MRTVALVAVCLLVACQPEQPAPAKEPLSPQLMARTGFLLEQIAKKDEEIRAGQDAVNALKTQIAAHDNKDVEQDKQLAAANAEVERLKVALVDSQELIRLRAKQIVTAFSKGAGCTLEVETLTRERDTCYVQLAEAMIPVPKKPNQVYGAAIMSPTSSE